MEGHLHIPWEELDGKTQYLQNVNYPHVIPNEFQIKHFKDFGEI